MDRAMHGDSHVTRFKSLLLTSLNNITFINALAQITFLKSRISLTLTFQEEAQTSYKP